jgi:hypothetical protein
MDIQKLQNRIETLPQLIRDQELAVIEAEHLYQLDKLSYDVAFSQVLIRSKLANATEKKAEALVETQEIKTTLLESERNLKKQESMQKYLENRFIAVRKLMSGEERHFIPNTTGN